jgi:predicted permease
MRFPWNRMETDLKRELAHHLHELTAEYERRGHSHEEATWMAKREFGGSEQVKDMCRDERRWAWMSGIRQDLVFAVRQMRRSPGFALTAILTLALGIAANVVVFGVLQALVLRPLDVPNADRIMTLARKDQNYPIFAYPEVRDVRDGNTVFSAVAAWTVNNFGLDANGVTRPVWGWEVGGQYFEVLAIKPFLGRLLQRADDDHPGASDAALLSYSGWKSYFGSDPDVVGKTIRINKHPYTIVGVTPEGFYGTEKFLQPSLFVPLANHAWLGEGDLESRRDKSVWSIVRLKDGVAMPQIQAELNAIAARTARQYPKEEEKLSFKLTRPGLMGDFFGAPARAFLAGVMALAGIVLLAACANLGSLFAARTSDRTREIAIRMAIGSSRWRILRQVLVEALMISLLGGACACGLAWIALAGLAEWHPPTEYPFHFLVVGPQPSLILVALLISVLTGALFGVMPLRQIFKTDPNDAIKSGGSQSVAGRRWALRDLLLAGQIALCCVTVTAAFVSLRGLGKALSMDLGFKPQNAVVARFELSQAGYQSAAADRFQRQLLERASQLPGVVAAAYANSTPLSQDTADSAVFSQQTTDFRPSNKAFSTYDYYVSPGYFAAAGTPLLEGRDVSFADTPASPAVAIVNQRFARHLFHSDHAVGRYFKNRFGVPIRIVGMAPDGKYLSLSEDPDDAAFFPVSQKPTTKTSLIVRLRPDSPEASTNEMAATIRKLIRDLDSTVPIRQSSAWNNQLGLTYFLSQIATAALGLFGAFGLLLSIAGAFGLASYTVSKRMRELSIRVALGAQAKQLLAAALGRMLILLASGSVVGIVLGVAASRLLSAIVYQASAQDPLVLIAVALTMVLTGLLAVAGPVRRALHIDPVKLLREQ